MTAAAIGTLIAASQPAVPSIQAREIVFSGEGNHLKVSARFVSPSAGTSSLVVESPDRPGSAIHLTAGQAKTGIELLARSFDADGAAMFLVLDDETPGDGLQFYRSRLASGFNLLAGPTTDPYFRIGYGPGKGGGLMATVDKDHSTGLMMIASTKEEARMTGSDFTTEQP